MKLIYTFNEFFQGSLYGISLIHIPSKQIILMIGGTVYDESYDSY